MNGKYRAAYELYIQALEFGNDHRVLIDLGYMYLQLGRLSEGCYYIKEAVKQRPYVRRYNSLLIRCKTRRA